MSRALALTGRAPVLEVERRRLEALRAQAGEENVRLAVVGLSSGGKSSFLNALMGEALLPEATGATTNVLTRCRKGDQRRLMVRFEDGSEKVYQGLALNAEAIATWCDEALNPDNHKAVAYLEWTTPLSALPEGLVLLDTPGLDAYGHEALGAVTLETCLPAADAIVYVAPLRQPLSAPDLALLERLVTFDQRVLFVLTQADREADTYQGGRLYRSRDEKIARHLARFEAALAASPMLRRAGVAAVATPWAAARDADAWCASGVEAVLEHFRNWAGELGEALRRERGRRLLTHVAELAERLSVLLDQAPAPPIAPAERAPESSLEAAVVALESRWRERLDPPTRLAGFRQGLAALGDDAAVIAFGHACRAEWEQVQATMVAEMSELQRQGRSALEAAGLEPSQWAAVKSFHVGAYFPEAGPFKRRVERPHSGGWSWDLLAWKKPEQVEVLDRAAYATALEAFVAKTSRELNHYLGFWVSTMRASTLEPLAAIAAPEPTEPDLRGELERLATTARAALGELTEPAPAAEPASALPARRLEAAGALHPLIAIFREAGFQRDFMRFLEGLRPDLAAPRRVLLLGPRREAALKLAALLAHDLGRLDAWQTAPETAWLASGSDAPYALEAPDTVLARLDLVVAPADAALPALDWPTLFADFEAIGVEVDATRLGCGYSTLARAPYAEALRAMADKVFFTCGDGGLFGAHRLVDLPEVLATPGPLGARPWFVYEDYDARYTDFMRLMGEPALDEGGSRALVRRWRLAGLPEDAPFAEADLRRAAQQHHHFRLLRRAR